MCVAQLRLKEEMQNFQVCPGASLESRTLEELQEAKKHVKSALKTTEYAYRRALNSSKESEDLKLCVKELEMAIETSLRSEKMTLIFCVTGVIGGTGQTHTDAPYAWLKQFTNETHNRPPTLSRSLLCIYPPTLICFRSLYLKHNSAECCWWNFLDRHIYHVIYDLLEKLESETRAGNDRNENENKTGRNTRHGQNAAGN